MALTGVCDILSFVYIIDIVFGGLHYAALSSPASEYNLCRFGAFLLALAICRRATTTMHTVSSTIDLSYGWCFVTLQR